MDKGKREGTLDKGTMMDVGAMMMKEGQIMRDTGKK
jgi:hypothetical protein